MSNAVVGSVNVLHTLNLTLFFLNKSHHIINMPIVLESLNACAEILGGYNSIRCFAPASLILFPSSQLIPSAYSVSRASLPCECYPCHPSSATLLHTYNMLYEIYTANHHQIPHLHPPPPTPPLRRDKQLITEKRTIADNAEIYQIC